MEKYKLNIIIYAALVVFFTTSCNKILDKTPLDQYSDATLWSDVNLADSYLMDCYYRIPYDMWWCRLGTLTDEMDAVYPGEALTYYKGLLTADNVVVSGLSIWDLTYANWSLFPVVQRVNVFLENIDKVADAYNEPQKTTIKAQIEIMRGEALFIRAFIYTKMCQSYGGLPILKKANILGKDYSTLTRATFKETVDFIAADCDTAAQLLQLKRDMDLGRATKEAALTLKSRILLFAASDLTADGTADNELVGYLNPDRNALWTAAKNAAKAVMDLETCQLADFGAPDKAAVATKYYDFFRAQDLSNKEVIWGRMFLPDKDILNQTNLWQGANGNNNWGECNPAQQFVDDYEMEDGSKFYDHFMIDANGYYNNKSTKFTHENIYYNREPRFYASILYDSTIWQPRFDNFALRDPLGIYERRTHRTIMGVDTTDVPGLDSRSSPMEDWNGSYTGYLMKKTLDHTVIGRDQNNSNVWIEFRFAEVIMNYAEACLGLGDTPQAGTYINMIRNRAALPNFVGDITEALHHERQIEFAFESQRWYDLRRWKILEKKLVTLIGIDILEVTKDNTITTTWRQIQTSVREPVSKKMYWIPISRAEINRAPWLVQNPGY